MVVPSSRISAGSRATTSKQGDTQLTESRVLGPFLDPRTMLSCVMSNRGWVVVVGTSAGGLEALKGLVAQLPATFGAPVFVVQHMSADGDGSVLARALDASGALSCAIAKDGERFTAGRIYVAPADHHLLLKKTTVIVTKGARENR